ncbi:MAG: family 43 glycosylhydrolase, partial [Muribaculaceae bacterium]|nr:family 43 glycosylhydrolase [Muribaculaceae bacterium]
LYFSANNTATNRQVIGVAKAPTPTGPYVAIDTPVITDSPVDSGYQIDVTVYDDILSDITYIYWGSHYLAVAELNDDKTSIKPGTVKVITPEVGTNQAYAYNGAPYVLYRNGIYYFMWSAGDFNSPDYHVVYGTSSSPTGPITVADDPIIIKADPEKNIYGVGQNSVVQIPGTNDWYIAYHRFNQNFLDPDDHPELHREVCIDSIKFDNKGHILPIRPSL